MVQEELEALGAKVIMTRSDDTFIELTNRPAIANDAKADVLLSIHRNSYEADASVKVLRLGLVRATLLILLPFQVQYYQLLIRLVYPETVVLNVELRAMLLRITL